MSGPAPAVVQTAWARAVIAALTSAGVRDLVVSPGSRSTPLVCAALASEIRCHAVIDERSAAFFALGQIRTTGRPTATLCTSGSAAGHAFPAVLEAHHAHLPLIVITADRPPGLQTCGAPQAMDQIKLFGQAVRGFVDLGLPQAQIGHMRAARRRVAQLAHTAQSPVPGPVHLNVAAHKPLEPAGPVTDDDHAFCRDVDGLLAVAVSRPSLPRHVVPPENVDALAAACRVAQRGLIVAGPAPTTRRAAAPTLAALSAATGFPILVEAASQLRFVGDGLAPGACDAFELLLRSRRFTAATRPDLILQVGPAPVSAAWRDFLAHTRPAARWVLCDHEWQDPTSDATALLFGDVVDTVERLVVGLGDTAPATAWRDRMVCANRRAWHALEAALGASDVLSEPAAVRAAIASLEPGTRLLLGNSLPIRDADAWCPGRSADVQVITQRGLNGIDGLIATAAGAASVGDTPVTLVLGDVSFAHDVSSLATVRHVKNPLTIVVIDNHGGRIFDRLPIANAGLDEARFEQFWRMPAACDVAKVADAFGISHSKPRDASAVAAAVRAARSRRAASVIHVSVAPDSAATCFATAVRAFDESWSEDDHD